MKRFLILAAAIAVPAAATLHAQIAAPFHTTDAATDEAGVPSQVAPPARAAATASAGAAASSERDAASTVPLPGTQMPAGAEKSVPLIPDVAPEPTPVGGKRAHRRHGDTAASVPVAPVATGSSSTFANEQDVRTRIRLRIALTRARNDPALDEQWAAAHRTHTDPERRVILTDYYNRLYDRAIKIDPSVAEKANARRQAALSKMQYRRLGDIDNSEDPFTAPTPAPPGSNEQLGLGSGE